MALAKPLVAVLAALAIVSAALAAGPIVRKNAADEALARSTVVQRADLGGTGWKGKVTAVAKPEPLSCPGFSPKQSDLVVTGAAASEWQNQATNISSEADILQTAGMVRLDWSRTIRPPLVKCLAKAFTGSSGGTTVTAVSAQKIAFPQVAPLTAAYRVVAEVSDSGQTVRVVSDVILLGKGRSEATLTFLGPEAGKAAMVAAERRIARIVASRLRS
ncbi:MAG TPA: hypothetical protein VGJ77_22435 [Gaiellaceae bacterium]|jgi:hypothetical protein